YHVALLWSMGPRLRNCFTFLKAGRFRTNLILLPRVRAFAGRTEHSIDFVLLAPLQFTTIVPTNLPGEHHVRNERPVDDAPNRARQRKYSCRRRRAWRHACARAGTQDLRAGAWRLAWRLVLAGRRRPLGEERPQGLHADADRRGRPLTSHEQGHQSRHPHR